MGDDYVRVTLRVERVTDRAVLLSNDEVSAWVPRSCIHGADDIAITDSRVVGEEKEFRIREWKATEVGFI